MKRAAHTLIVPLLFLLSAVHVFAQQMEVLDFSRYKPAPQLGLATDRSPDGCLMDFETSESGFEFLADGKTPLEPQEEDGYVRVLIPRKTAFLSISHPDFGKCLWKLPVKPGRFKHYTAYLKTYNPDKVFKLSKQWLGLEITPPEAIVSIDDSGTTLVRDGRAQFNLPVGPHKYTVESPFHLSVEDSLSLSDTGKVCRQISLQPFYSYISVDTDSPEPEVYLDREFIGRGTLTTGRISPGEHRLTVLWDGLYFYDSPITVEPAAKKSISLRKDRDASTFWHSSRWSGAASKDAVLEDPLEVLARAIPDSADAASTGQMPPDTAWLNIHSNITGAIVFVDGTARGLTPCIVEKVPGHEQCSITLSKEGYKSVSVQTRPHSGDLTDVKINMKEIRKGK